MTAALALPQSGSGPTSLQVTSADRLALTFCLGLLVHAMVIFGVSFTAPPPVPPEYMDIILVQRASIRPNPEAEILAQANSEGGGDSSEDVRPTAPFEAPLPAPTPNVVSAAPSAAPAPPPTVSPEPAVTPPEPLVESPPAPVVEAPEPEPAIPPPPVLASEAPAPEKVQTPPPEPPPPAKPRPSKAKAEIAERPAPPVKPLPKPEVAKQEAPPSTAQAAPKPSAATLMSESFAVASLNAEVQQKLEARSKRPRRKFISANTRDYKYAAYMEAWRAKVERVGNLNYPDEARRQGLSGSLILDVALRPDGAIEEIVVRKSSGHAVLDAAAVRIVELAAPYAPFPQDFMDEVDVLHVTRTWQFLNNYRFSAR